MSGFEVAIDELRDGGGKARQAAEQLVGVRPAAVLEGAEAAMPGSRAAGKLKYLRYFWEDEGKQVSHGFHAHADGLFGAADLYEKNEESAKNHLDPAQPAGGGSPGGN